MCVAFKAGRDSQVKVLTGAYTSIKQLTGIRMVICVRLHTDLIANANSEFL